MNIRIIGKSPIISLTFQSFDGDLFNQDFLLDTGFTGYIAFYSSNLELLRKIKKISNIMPSKIKLIIGNGQSISTLESETIVYANNKLLTVEFLVIQDEGNTSDLPLIGISFLEFLKSKLILDFELKKYDLIFRKN